MDIDIEISAEVKTFDDMRREIDGMLNNTLFHDAIEDYLYHHYKRAYFGHDGDIENETDQANPNFDHFMSDEFLTKISCLAGVIEADMIPKIRELIIKRMEEIVPRLPDISGETLTIPDGMLKDDKPCYHNYKPVAIDAYTGNQINRCTKCGLEYQEIR